MSEILIIEDNDEINGLLKELLINARMERLEESKAQPVEIMMCLEENL